MSLWRHSQALRVTTWIVVAFVVLVVAPWGYLYWRTERDLAAELQRIRDAGEPVSMRDLIPPQIPDDGNAAVVYVGLAADDGHGRLRLGTREDDRYKWDFLRDGTGDAQVRAFLARPDVVQALEEVERASWMRYATPAADADRSLHGVPRAAPVARDLASWLQARAVLQARDGDTDGAWQTVATISRMAAQERSDPAAHTYADGLRRAAESAGWAVLEEADPPPEVMAALKRDLPALDPRAEAEAEIRVFRANLVDMFAGMDVAPTEILGVPTADLPRGQRLVVEHYDSLLLRPARNSDLLGILEMTREALENVRSGSAGPAAVGGRMHGASGALQEALVGWAAPVCYFVNEVDLGNMIVGHAMFDLSQTSIFRTALLLVEHRRMHGGYPGSLSELTLPPGPDPTEDPFSGGQLKYRREGDGFVLYSVGRNCIDDGGADDDIVRALTR